MVEGKPIFVRMGKEDNWIPATEYELNVEVVGPSLEAFFKVWDQETQQRLLDSAIEKENYEQAKIIHGVMNDLKI